MFITTSSDEKDEIRRHGLELEASRILEVGTFKGSTTAVLSEVAAAHGGYVVAIDPMIWSSKPAHLFEWIDGLLHPTSYERAFWRNVTAKGHDNVRLIKALSTDSALLASSDPGLAEFDLAFIDGEHTYQGVMQDIANWGSRIRAGGRMLLHDVARRFPGVVSAMKALEQDANVQVTWPTRGMVGTVEILEPIDRDWYLDTLRNGQPKVRARRLFPGIALIGLLSLGSEPAAGQDTSCGTRLDSANAARPAWVGEGVPDVVWRLADVASSTEDGDERRCLLLAAEDEARGALAATPDAVGLRFALAVVLGLRADREGGRTKVRAASQLHDELRGILALEPEHARARHLLGRLHAGVVRMDRVTRWIATNLLGGGSLKAATWAEAERHLVFAEARAPEVLDHHFELARLYEDTNRPGQALEEAKHVLALAPRSDMEQSVTDRTEELIDRLSVARQ